MDKLFKVEIRERGTNEVVNKTEPTNLRRTGKLEQAYLNRIDLKKYYCIVVEA